MDPSDDRPNVVNGFNLDLAKLFLAPLIQLHNPVFQSNDTCRALDHPLVMSHENEGFTLSIQLIKQIQDFLA